MNSRGGILFVSFYAVQFKALGKRLICGQRVSKPTLRARAAKGHLETFPALPRMSAVGSQADVPRAWLVLLLLAEGVEKVPRTRSFETIIQNPGRC